MEGSPQCIIVTSAALCRAWGPAGGTWWLIPSHLLLIPSLFRVYSALGAPIVGIRLGAN